MRCFWRGAPTHAQHDAVPWQTLFKVVQNVLQTPENEAMRKLSRESNSFQHKIAPAKGAVRFLRAVGFEEQGSGEEVHFVMATPDLKVLEEGKAALKACVKEYGRMQEETRRIENEAAAVKLRMLKEVSKSNQSQEVQEERERQQALLKRDREDYARQRDNSDLR